MEIRNGEIVVIVSSESDAARSFLKVLSRSGFGRRAANGLAAGMGVSLDAKEVARLPQSLEEARLALDFVNVTQPILHFADIDLPEFLIRRAEPTALRLIPEWTRHFTGAGQSGELSRTVRAFADSSLNVKQTARRLGVHANTVYFRLNRVNQLTGIDPRSFAGISLLVTALRLMEAHNT